jgi:hypothetical protein
MYWQAQHAEAQRTSVVPTPTRNMRVVLHGNNKSPDLSEAICVLKFFLERLDNFAYTFPINGHLDIAKEHRLDSRATPRVQGLICQ